MPLIKTIADCFKLLLQFERDFWVQCSITTSQCACFLISLLFRVDAWILFVWNQ